MGSVREAKAVGIGEGPFLPLEQHGSVFPTLAGMITQWIAEESTTRRKRSESDR
jgi:hypothetical protein